MMAATMTARGSKSPPSRRSRIEATAPRDTRGTRASKAPAVGAAGPAFADPSACESCASIYTRRTWRADAARTHALLAKCEWTTCPACRQKKSGTAYGRVVVGGNPDARRLAAVERRVHNVVAYAGFTQPQRAIVSMERTGKGLEVTTTSQKLAHRIVHELKKAFGGRARYAWDEHDGTLTGTWSA